MNDRPTTTDVLPGAWRYRGLKDNPQAVTYHLKQTAMDHLKSARKSLKQGEAGVEAAFRDIIRASVFVAPGRDPNAPLPSVSDRSVSELTPPPMRVCVKGWLINRDLTKTEAAGFHLKEAAKVLKGGADGAAAEPAVVEHIEEARRNIIWAGKRFARAAKP